MSVGRETAADRPASDERRRRTVGKRYWYGWNTGGVRRETDEMSRPTVPHRMGNVRKRPGNVRNTDVLRWETEELRMDCQGGLVEIAGICPENRIFGRQMGDGWRISPLRTGIGRIWMSFGWGTEADSPGTVPGRMDDVRRRLGHG